MADEEKVRLNDLDLEELLRERYWFGRDDRNNSENLYVDKTTHVAALLSTDINSQLAIDLEYLVRHGTVPEKPEQYYEAPNPAALGRALRFASKEAQQHVLHVSKRSCRRGNEVWIDLGRNNGTALHIDSSGLEVREVPEDVAWRRSDIFAPMDGPVEGDRLEQTVTLLMAKMRIGRNAAAQLLALAVHMIIHPSGPGSQQPMLLVQGVSGSGKTVLSLQYQDLTDPTKARVEESGGYLDKTSLLMSTSEHAVVVIGNASKVDQDVWDLICSIVTGSSASARMLYSQTKLKRWFINSQLVITSVSLGRIPEDIVTRIVKFDVTPKADTALDEHDMWEDWDRDRNVMRTGLWQLCSKVLQAEEEKSVPKNDLKARLKDFELTLRAVDRILGTSGEQDWIDSTQEEQIVQQSDDPIVMAICSKKEDLEGQWLDGRGMYRVLKPVFDRLEAGNSGTKRMVPGSGRSISARFNRVIPALESMGVKVEERKNSHTKSKLWRLTFAPDADLTEIPLAPDTGIGSPFHAL